MNKVNIDNIIETSRKVGEITTRFYGENYSVEEKGNKTSITEADKWK